MEPTVLRVGMTGDYPPFCSQEDDGKWSGFEVDMALALGARLRRAVKIVKTTWTSCLDDLKAGMFDVFMSGGSITRGRLENGAAFSDAYYRTCKTAVFRKDSKTCFTSIESINHPEVRVIVNPGGVNQAFAHAHFPDAQVVVHGSNMNIFDEIVANRADVMVTDAVECHYHSKYGRYQNLLEYFDPGFTEHPVTKAYMVRQSDSSQSFLPKINEWLQEDATLIADLKLRHHLAPE